MKSAKSSFPSPNLLSHVFLAAALILSCGLTAAAQQPNSNSIEAQREAMQKLSFLAGQWKGPVTIARGPGEELHLTQTESVEYKLDGLVMLVEGQSTSADGKVAFRALATISYDDASHSYRFRAYNDGRYLDTELAVPERGFSWGFTAGPARIVNTMHLTETGEWNEATQVTLGANPPHRSMEMTLKKES
ncbi:MAG TPA: hypothetical protein VMJ93_16050 [Verrucomicrobiae bacterium]|nr:hypothetical protein [Verrucomicrobiae bacterium]